MNFNKCYKIEEDLRMKRGCENGFVFNPKSDFIYEASNDILDFIQLFNGEKSLKMIIAETKQKFQLNKNDEDQLLNIFNELLNENILLEVKSEV